MEDILETAPCGFLTFSDDGTIERVNATLYRMLGYSDGELVGRHFDRILPLAARIFYQTHFFPLLKLHGRVDEVYLTLRDKDGADHPTLLNAARRETDGRTVYDCVLLEMKERSEYETAILSAKKVAEEAIRAKDQFVAAVSHELRTPLHAVIGWVHLLRSRPQEPEIVEKGVGAIERSANSLKALIEDLIDLSRINSGKMRINVDRVDVAAVVDSAMEIVRPSADAKSITLERTIDPEAGPVSGDTERLQQVVWNLLSNAIKFTPKGGRVSVNLTRVNSTVRIAVTDTGHGIAPDFLPYVFDRFRQGETRPTGRGGGLGLGMAITKHLVELHGGTIRAESPGEGQGSTFTLLLPVMTVHRSEPFLASAMDRYDGRPGTGELGGLEGVWVLVVEDDAQARSMLTTVLEHAGSQVITASNVKEGLDQFRKYRPHVIISDIELRDGDGYSFIREVRTIEGPGTDPAPAIALTALAGHNERVRALAAGFNMHIPKPVEPIELILAISGLYNPARLIAGASGSSAA
jgi:PAS domain S-box-containing protein